MPPVPTLSAVIPVHNEEGFIDAALPRLVAAMEAVGEPFEIIVCENGSTDQTAEIAERIAAGDRRVHVLHLREADYGAAMRDGFKAARGDWIVNFDIDYFSDAFLREGLSLDATADVILGSKRAAGSDDRRPMLRRLGTWGFNLVLRILFGSKVSDTHGMKMVRRAVATNLVPCVLSTRDLFDTELVIRAERAGYRILEIPVTVEELRSARTSFVRRIPRTLRGMWLIRRAIRAEARSTD